MKKLIMCAVMFAALGTYSAVNAQDTNKSKKETKTEQCCKAEKKECCKADKKSCDKSKCAKCEKKCCKKADKACTKKADKK